MEEHVPDSHNESFQHFPYESAPMSGAARRKSKPAVTGPIAPHSVDEIGQQMHSSTEDIDSAISHDRLSKKDISEMVVPTNFSSQDYVELRDS